MPSCLQLDSRKREERGFRNAYTTGRPHCNAMQCNAMPLPARLAVPAPPTVCRAPQLKPEPKPLAPRNPHRADPPHHPRTTTAPRWPLLLPVRSSANTTTLSTRHTTPCASRQQSIPSHRPHTFPAARREHGRSVTSTRLDSHGPTVRRSGVPRRRHRRHRAAAQYYEQLPLLAGKRQTSACLVAVVVLGDRQRPEARERHWASVKTLRTYEDVEGVDMDMAGLLDGLRFTVVPIMASQEIEGSGNFSASYGVVCTKVRKEADSRSSVAASLQQLIYMSSDNSSGQYTYKTRCLLGTVH
ncbi:hypothetical protein IWX90DRAFT_493002 [Phyllosticta citrichinensis]|uniref:Uncharacterized protein n=1 Tax=Phyllosticta citrichinensis TaxID=1130410 RepID=A0ABR1Y7V9_9PEZI